MLIHIGYNIEFELPAPAEAFFALSVHPTCQARLRRPERLEIHPHVPYAAFVDAFGNQCGSARLPAGSVRFTNRAIIEDDGHPDPISPHARQHPVNELPPAVLPFLLPSRYCEVDSELANLAWGMFGTVPEGWDRVQAICDFVHQYLTFDYLHARRFAGAPLDFLACHRIHIVAAAENMQRHGDAISFRFFTAC